MISNSTNRITLRMQPGMKLLGTISAIVSAVFAIYFLMALIQHSDLLLTTQIGEAVVGLVFFGWGALLMLRLLIVGELGYLEFSESGLLIDTNFTGGIILWHALTAIGQVRAMGMKYLGISIENVDAYLASRSKEPALFSRSTDRTLTQGYYRFMFAFAPLKFLGPALTILGYTKVPEPPTEENFLKWNKENYGYHLLIPAFYVPNLEEVIRVISDYSGGQRKSSILGKATKHAPPGRKQCPMCAEYVKSEARICRFCKYKFDV